VFGQGGALLQIVNRDDQKFAMKCSAALVDGKWVDVFKDPITDKGKRSKKGRLVLIKAENNFKTFTTEDTAYNDVKDQDVLETVFVNGVLTRDMTFDEVRANAAI
jgi:nicotinamide phosphoribosyltransferase